MRERMAARGKDTTMKTALLIIIAIGVTFLAAPNIEAFARCTYLGAGVQRIGGEDAKNPNWVRQAWSIADPKNECGMY
jgi:hypothetical protein